MSAKQTGIVLSAVFAASSFFMPSLVSANTHDSNNGVVVYENTDFVFGFDAFHDKFDIQTAGTYRATLTDFEFPNKFDDIGIMVTDGPKDRLGALDGPGSFTFNANPGKYDIFFYGSVVEGDSFAGSMHRHSVRELGSYGIQIAMIPELETWLMLSMGGIALFYWVRRQRNRDESNSLAAAV